MHTKTTFFHHENTVFSEVAKKNAKVRLSPIRKILQNKGFEDVKPNDQLIAAIAEATDMPFNKRRFNKLLHNADNISLKEAVAITNYLGADIADLISDETTTPAKKYSSTVQKLK